MLKIPLGIDNYKNITDDYFYADKTDLIKEILDLAPSSVILYTRPRRFGKSLNMSMISTYFDITIDSRKYFINRKIMNYGSEYIKKMNSYPVLELSFKDICGETKESTIEVYKDFISGLYAKYYYTIFDSLNSFDKERYLKYMNKTIENSLYQDSLYDIIRYLSEFYNKKVIFLLDEYDNPLQNAFDKNYYEDIHMFFKHIFSKTLKSNNYIEYGIIFGIMEVAKGSIFSGLNNVIVNSILSSKKNEYFGFNEEDVLLLLNDVNKKEELNNIKEWYGGYYFSNHYIYNPWSVLNYVYSNFVYDLYWTNTISNLILETLIKNNSHDILSFLPTLLHKNGIIHNIDLSLNYSDLYNSSEALFSFLISSGYLSAVSKISVGEYLLEIPNNEMLILFKKEIVERFIKNKHSLSLPYYLKKSIIDNDVENINELFEKYILGSLSYYDFSDERDYHILFLSIMVLLFDDYYVDSEVNNGNGRCDIMIRSKEKNLGIIIEIKKSNTKLSSERLETLALRAIEQSQKMNYEEKLLKENQKHIIVYGVAFYKKSMKIKSLIIK